MRKTIFLFMLFAVAIPAEAGPLSWAKEHKRFLFMEAAAVGASGFEAAAVHHCRHRNGVEPCLAHYGEAWATFGVHAGLSTIVFPAIAEGCWNANDDSHWCDPLGFAFPVGQTVFAAGQWRQHEKKKDDDHPKPDFSDVVILRH